MQKLTITDKSTLAALDRIRVRQSSKSLNKAARVLIHAADPAPPDMPPALQPPPLGPVLDAWEALCSAAGKGGLTATQALTDRGERTEALGEALEALGVASPLRTAQALGSALRTLRERVDANGRRIVQLRSAGGVATWGVLAPSTGAA